MSVFLTLLYFLIGLFLFLIIREVIHNRRQSYRAAKQIAGAPIYPFIGNLYEVLFMNAGMSKDFSYWNFNLTNLMNSSNVHTSSRQS